MKRFIAIFCMLLFLGWARAEPTQTEKGAEELLKEINRTLDVIEKKTKEGGKKLDQETEKILNRVEKDLKALRKKLDGEKP